MYLEVHSVQLSTLEVYAQRLVLFLRLVDAVENERRAVLEFCLESVCRPICDVTCVRVGCLGWYLRDLRDGEQCPWVYVLVCLDDVRDVVGVEVWVAVYVWCSYRKLEDGVAHSLNRHLALSVYRLRVELVDVSHRKVGERYLLAAACQLLGSVCQCVAVPAVVHAVRSVACYSDELDSCRCLVCQRYGARLGDCLLLQLQVLEAEYRVALSFHNHHRGLAVVGLSACLVSDDELHPCAVLKADSVRHAAHLDFKCRVVP